MRVRYRESGGIVATFRGVDLDVAGLAPAEAAELRTLVRAATTGVVASGESSKTRDDKELSIAIDDGGASISLAYEGRAVPAAAKPLVRFLRARARPMKR